MYTSRVSPTLQLKHLFVDHVKQAIPDDIDNVISCLDQLRVEVPHRGNHRVYQAVEEVWGSL